MERCGCCGKRHILECQIKEEADKGCLCCIVYFKKKLDKGGEECYNEGIERKEKEDQNEKDH